MAATQPMLPELTDAQKQRPVTRAVLDAFYELVVLKLFKRQQDELGELRAANAELRRDVAALEARGLEFKGVWNAATDYRRGDVALAGGSSWIAVVPTCGNKPGSSDAWRLLAQRGRDGKDAR